MEVIREKEMPKISIIVPIYKVEKYINKCIESILNQTFEDFELILVDDGSPDKCGEICDEYAKKDKRVRVIHKKNGGLSDARNKGIYESKGEYIGFVDSDDYIASDMYKVLYDDIVRNNAEVSVCGIYNCYNNIVKVECSNEYHMTVNGEEALKMALEGKLFSVPACNKLYKKECFADIKFPVGKTSEDAFTIPTVLSRCKKVSINTLPKYYYIHREDSITSAKFNENDFDVIEAYYNNLKMVREKFPNCEKEAEYRYIWSYAYVLDKMLLSKDFTDYQSEDEIVLFLRKNILNVLFNRCFLPSRKFANLILLFNKNLYKKLLIKNRTQMLKLNS